MNTKAADNQMKDNGFYSLLYAIGSNPLDGWSFNVKNGHIKRLKDQDIRSPSIEIIGANVESNYIVTPVDNKQSLGIKMPTIVLLIKNLQKYFEFSITVLDDKKIRRVFKSSNFQTLTRVKGNFCSLPMKLEDGWNQIHINFIDFVQKAFGTNYVETVAVQINANCRIRRIYFTEFADFENNYRKIPPEYKVFAAIEEDTSEKGAIQEEKEETNK
ncbi:MAG: CFAP20 family protein [archaeon]|nr:CFAP20 family protein [archaeon]